MAQKGKWDKINTVSNKIAWLVAMLIMLLFSIGIGWAACCTLWVGGAPRPECMPALLAVLVSALNSALALNFGILLGIHVALGSQEDDWLSKVWALRILAIWYGIAWLFATIVWGVKGFTEETCQIVAVLPEVSETGVKIFVTVLFALLGLKTAYKRFVEWRSE